MLRRIVVRTEDSVQRLVTGGLRRLGRPVHALVFPGYGTDGWARVLARVVVEVSEPLAADEGPPTTSRALRANLRQFVTFEVPSATVRVECGTQRREVRADRDGYVDLVLGDVGLPPGRHTVTVTPLEPPGGASTGPLHMYDGAAATAVVSDIDDTIIDSGVARGFVATVTTALLHDSATRVPLQGAPELYRALAEDVSGAAPPTPFFYLSTSPWNLAGFLCGFLERHGFPAGPLLLTDWGPGSTGLFRISSREHKLSALRRLAGEMPHARFVLLGDSGQQDAEIYSAFTLEHPDRVGAVYIRRAPHTAAGQQERLDRSAAALAEVGVPFVVADDSASMLEHLRGAGGAGS